MTFLSKMVLSVRRRVEQKKRKIPVGELPNRSTEFRSLIRAIRKSETVPVIAEIKPRSPSTGMLRSSPDVIALAKEYECGGAIGISVLTEPDYFGGSLENLTKVKTNVTLPVLRKDFIVDEYQVYESAAHNADSILLIVPCLDDKLQDFLVLACRLGLEALVECHSSQEIEEALEAGARMIGINNRDLETLKVDLTRTEELAPTLPDDVIIVSESGIHNPQDVRRVVDAGADAVLVGTAFMCSENVRRKVRSLVNAR